MLYRLSYSLGDNPTEGCIRGNRARGPSRAATGLVAGKEQRTRRESHFAAAPVAADRAAPPRVATPSASHAMALVRSAVNSGRLKSSG